MLFKGSTFCSTCRWCIWSVPQSSYSWSQSRRTTSFCKNARKDKVPAGFALLCVFVCLFLCVFLFLPDIPLTVKSVRLRQSMLLTTVYKMQWGQYYIKCVMSLLQGPTKLYRCQSIGSCLNTDLLAVGAASVFPCASYSSSSVLECCIGWG